MPIQNMPTLPKPPSTRPVIVTPTTVTPSAKTVAPTSSRPRIVSPIGTAPQTLPIPPMPTGMKTTFTMPTLSSLPKPPTIIPPAPIADAASSDTTKEAINKLKALKDKVKTIQAKEATETSPQVTEDKVVEDKVEQDVAKIEAQPTENTNQEPATNTTTTEVSISQEEKEEKATSIETSDVKPVKEPKKRGARKTKTTTTETTQTVASIQENTITLTLEPTCKDFQEMETLLYSTFNDPEWEAEKESIAQEDAKIIIEQDMNPTLLKGKVVELCNLRNRIALDYYKYQKNFLDASNDKPEGIIERVKRLYSQGNNDFERRRNGILACMQYDLNGTKINLFEYLEQIRERYLFYKSIMESIEWKSKVIITMNSAILMEQKLDK